MVFWGILKSFASSAPGADVCTRQTLTLFRGRYGRGNANQDLPIKHLLRSGLKTVLARVLEIHTLRRTPKLTQDIRNITLNRWCGCRLPRFVWYEFFLVEGSAYRRLRFLCMLQIHLLKPWGHKDSSIAYLCSLHSSPPNPFYKCRYCHSTLPTSG